MDRYATGPRSFGAACWIPGVKTEKTAKKRRKNEQKWARYSHLKRVRVADLFVMDRYNDVGRPAGYNTTSAEPLSWSNVGDVEFGYMPFGGAAATWEVKQCGAQSVAKLGR